MPRYPIQDPAPGYGVDRAEKAVLGNRFVRYFPTRDGQRIERDGKQIGFRKRAEAVGWTWQDLGQRKAAEETREGTEAQGK